MDFETFKAAYQAAEDRLWEIRNVGLELGHLENESDYDGERYELTDPARRLEIQEEKAEWAKRVAEAKAKRKEEFVRIWSEARTSAELPLFPQTDLTD